jgi:hypothetical protein
VRDQHDVEDHQVDVGVVEYAGDETGLDRRT